MPTYHLNLSCPVHDSFRVQQVLGMFDMPARERVEAHFDVELPGDDEPWQIGAIVGPSGSGKSSVARKGYGRDVYCATPWPADRAVIDCFGDFPTRQIIQTLCAVGFSSPPAWIKPMAVLSNGERFRCELARALIGLGKGIEGGLGEGTEGRRDNGTKGEQEGEGTEGRGDRAVGSALADAVAPGSQGTARGGLAASAEAEFTGATLELPKAGRAASAKADPTQVPLSLRPSVPSSSPSSSPFVRTSPCPLVPSPIIVFDEFTSVVDRTVARIGSAAVSRAIRSGKINRRFVAVTCHYDVVPWLEPDWVLDMASQTLTRRRVRRPGIRLDIRRADRSLWPLFARHHYLSGDLHRAAKCFVAYFQNQPAAFTAVLPFPHPIRPGWREHRTVCLPDYQGVGIGSSMSDYIASLFVATNKPYFSTTGHPSVIRHRARSPLWKMRRAPGLVGKISPSGIGKTGMHDTLSTLRLTAGFEYIGPPRTPEARKLGVVGRQLILQR